MTKMLSSAGLNSLTFAAMTQEVRSAIALWKEAVAEVRAAEALLARARDEYETMRAPAVSTVLLEQVAQARERADKKLSAALEMIRSKSAS